MALRQFGLLVEHAGGERPGPFEQGGVGGEVGKAQQGGAGLAGTEEFAGATDVQVTPGDLEAVAGLRHGFEALAGGFAQAATFALGVQQHAGRCRRAAPHATPQLVQLAEAKAFSMLDHHQRGIGHVHTNLNHGSADQHSHVAVGEQRHHGQLFCRGHARMQQADQHARQGRAQGLKGGGGVDEVDVLAFLNQRADPVDLPPVVDLGLDALDHLVAPGVDHQLGDDGGAARGQLVQRGDIQVGVIAHRQGPRDGCCGHHQQMRLVLKRVVVCY